MATLESVVGEGENGELTEAQRKKLEADRKLRKKLRDEKIQRDKETNKYRQVRKRKKKKLVTHAIRFAQKLYIARPKNMTLSQIRTLHSRINAIMRLRWGWTEEELERAWKELLALEKKVYGEKHASYSENYQNLLNAVMEPLQNMEATLDERVDVVTEAMHYMAEKLNGEYGDEKPATEKAALLALTSMKRPQPAWFVEGMVEHIVNNFNSNDAIRLSNLLYEELAKLQEQRKRQRSDASILANVEEDKYDEMVIGGEAVRKGGKK